MAEATEIALIEDHVKFWTTHNKFKQADDDIIAFIGPTKSGKSTLINCLMKKRLFSKQNDASGEWTIVKADEDDGGPKIGEGAESESLLPQCYGNFGETHFQIWDFPGFGDNKGVKQEVANAISVKTVLCKQKSVKFVLVVPFETIKCPDPSEFFELLNSILKISPNIAQHLILVASKMEKGNLENVLRRLINTPFNNADSERLKIINEARGVIQVLLDNGALFKFKSPLDGYGKKDVYILPDAPDFYKCLNKCEGINVSNCNMVISRQAQVKLVELHDIIYNVLRIIIIEIVECIQRKAGRKLENLRSMADKQDAISYGKRKCEKYRRMKENGSDLQDLLTQVGTTELRKSAIVILNNFKHLEKLRNSFTNNVNGEDEFNATLVTEINNTILAFSKEVENIDRNVKFVSRQEEEEMAKTRNKAGLLSKENLLNVCSSISSFCINNFGSIINVAMIIYTFWPTPVPIPPPSVAASVLATVTTNFIKIKRMII